jgi:hypothetical protein
MKLMKGVFGALYLLLLYYWINERFMDIVFYLFALMGLALITGNLALTGLAKNHLAKRKNTTPGSQDAHEKAD